jgi:hypothetical protein
MGWSPYRAYDAPMEVDAFLADSVQAAGGKLHGLGIGWRVLQAGGFPVRHDRIGIGIIVRTPPDASGSHTLSLSLVGPGGSHISFGTDRSGTPRPTLEAPFTTPSGDGSATLALNLDGLVFQAEGAYEFVVSVDGLERARLRFRVQTTPEPPAAEYRTGVYL